MVLNAAEISSANNTVEQLHTYVSDRAVFVRAEREIIIIVILINKLVSLTLIDIIYCRRSYVNYHICV